MFYAVFLFGPLSVASLPPCLPKQLTFMSNSCCFPFFLSENTGTPAGGKPVLHWVGGSGKRRKAGKGVGSGGRGPLEAMASRCVVIRAENWVSAAAIWCVYQQTLVPDKRCGGVWFSIIKKNNYCSVYVSPTTLRLN